MGSPKGRKGTKNRNGQTTVLYRLGILTPVNRAEIPYLKGPMSPVTIGQEDLKISKSNDVGGKIFWAEHC